MTKRKCLRLTLLVLNELPEVVFFLKKKDQPEVCWTCWSNAKIAMKWRKKVPFSSANVNGKHILFHWRFESAYKYIRGNNEIVWKMKVIWRICVGWSNNAEFSSRPVKSISVLFVRPKRNLTCCDQIWPYLTWTVSLGLPLSTFRQTSIIRVH